MRALRLLSTPGALLTLGFTALYLTTFNSRMADPSELQRFRLAIDLALHGPGALLHSGATSRYPPLVSLVAAFPARLGQWIDFQSPDGLLVRRLVVGTSLLVCVALVPVFGVLARTLGLDDRQATYASLLFGLTNPLWPYSKRLDSEPLSALLTLGAFTGVLVFLRTGRRGPLAAGLVSLALLPLNDFVVPVAVASGLCVLAWLENRRRLAAMILASALLGAATAKLLLRLRFGSWSESGYGHEQFTFQLVDAFHGFLFGPGRSVFLFAPLTLLAPFGWPFLARRERGFATGATVAIALCFGAMSCWWEWYGGVCWGPRLLLPILPLASAGAIPLLRHPSRLAKGVIVLVASGGLWVQLLGCSFLQGYDQLRWMRPDSSDERLAWFDLKHSPLVTVPADFRDRPWDISSEYLTVERPLLSILDIALRPVQEVHVVRGFERDSTSWTVTDVYAVVRGPTGDERIPAGGLGAILKTFDQSDTAAAVDGDPATHWTADSDRPDGMWLTLDFGRTRTDVARIEIDHSSADSEQSDTVQATFRAGDGPWTVVRAETASPRLHWGLPIYLFPSLGLILILAAVGPRQRVTRAA